MCNYLHTKSTPVRHAYLSLYYILMAVSNGNFFYRDFVGQNKTVHHDLIEEWVLKFTALFEKLKGHRPNIAIVDFLESGTSAEFEAFQEAYKRKGYFTVIADPKELDFDGEHLYYKKDRKSSV